MGKKEVIAPIVFRDADILIQNPLSGWEKCSQI